jgi:DNA-binding PadR family transcriptional regulator
MKLTLKMTEALTVIKSEGGTILFGHKGLNQGTLKALETKGLITYSWKAAETHATYQLTVSGRTFCR